MIDKRLVTGLVLAGGRGSRMGGADKGLQLHRGQPMALHALQRLGTQVGELMLSANRNLAAYAAMGVPVWPDAQPDFPGPLAGLACGLAHCTTPYLAAVPCDSPNFPHDLVAHLAAGLETGNAGIAIAATRAGGGLRAQPVFCLLRADAATGEALARFMANGGRSAGEWAAAQQAVRVAFDDAAAFANANTPAEMQALQAHG